MKSFKYVARNKDGAVLKGSLRAVNREDVVEILQGKDLIVVDVREDIGFSLDRLNEINIGGVPIKEKSRMMRQLATMIAAGIPLTKALSILSDQAQNPFLKRALVDALSMVEGGASLAEAFRKQEGMFDDIVLSLIEAGEASGTLEEILSKLAIELEEKKQLQARVRSAMIYPIILVVVMIAVIIILMVVLVPAMQEIYDGTDAVLPAPTRLLISMSISFQHYWWGYLLATLALVFGLKYYLSLPSGKTFFDNLVLKIPVFGSLIKKMQVAQFTRVLSLLLSSGLSIIEALELTAQSLSNTAFKNAVQQAATEVEKGSSLSLPLSRTEIFPIIVSQMIAVGEESGKLGHILSKLSEDFNDEVKTMTENLSTILEPLMLVIMGGMIGFIALAVYAPMFNLTNAI